MKATLITSIAIAALVFFLPGSASAPETVAEDPLLTTPVETPAPEKPKATTTPYQARPWTPPDAQPYKDELRLIAEAKGLPESKIIEIEGVIGGDKENALCPNGESGWYAKAVGDKGTSFGLVQIHLPAHPHITREQAEDPTFALTFIVDEFLKGNEWKWTCWKALYGATPPLPHSTGASV